jgi:glycosyltransferase involved in cell wall biosynthesis
MTGEPRRTISAIVCAYNEASYLPACLHALLAQTRQPDEIIVIDNASTDSTGELARRIPGVRVIHEPVQGLVVARETARLAAGGDILAYVDADCRPPIMWLERVGAPLHQEACPGCGDRTLPLL